jgi:hypothetical protein
MSSSRSIAAARSRRAGEPIQPMSGTRPGTSINSHAAFVPQYQGQPPPITNVRVAKTPLQSNVNVQQQQQQQTNSLPFSKLSISDAIGLVTLRLGRVEQFIIDLENGEHPFNTGDSNNLPDNTKLIDNSVLTSIINRLDSLEKKDLTSGNNDQVTKIHEDLANTKESVSKINDDLISQNEYLLKELNETKHFLQTIAASYDSFVKETNDKFIDYEVAISDIEKNLQIDASEIEYIEKNVEQNNEETNNVEKDDTSGFIMSVDLKNVIKQELLNKN